MLLSLETTVFVLIGLACGAMLSTSIDNQDHNSLLDQMVFDPRFFTFVLLPPIIFHTGIHFPCGATPTSSS
jgi:hypothetical protein